MRAPLPPDPFVGVTTYTQAKQLFEKFPRVRILFDNGGGADPGAPAPRFEADYPSWPVPGITATTVVLRPGGNARRPRTERRGRQLVRLRPVASARHDDPRRQPVGDVGQVAGVHVGTHRKPAPRWRTRPRRSTSDVTVVGNASVDLWLKSTAPDTDLQVTITEVRPDGKETFVQNGWLRASDRALAPDATDLRPTHPFTAGRLPNRCPRGTFVLARVEVFPFAHAFRAGSRIRVIIDAPGGSRPAWSFEDLPAHGHEVNTVGFGAAVASRIVLPVVAGVDVAPGLPACPSLRGQPCRSDRGDHELRRPS